MDKINQIKFFIKSCIIFSILSCVFSLTGLGFIFPNDAQVIGNPLIVSNPTLEHIVGHILFGMIAGAISLSLRYVFLTGAFAILLDADHLLQFFDIEMISRMSHSIVFAIIVGVIMFIISKFRDYRLAAIAFSAILSHIAFDIFLRGQLTPGSPGGFPIFAPFSVDVVNFYGYDWIFLEILAFSIVGIVTFMGKKFRNVEKSI